eukprot:UN04097
MNTDGSLPTEPIAPKGAVQCCSNELCTGDTYSTSAVVGSSISRVNVGPSDTNHDECCKFTLFKDFTISGLGRLGCGCVERC